jgi:hypothetical protein
MAQAPAELSLKEIYEKHLQFSGGKEKLSQIQNYSFRASQSAYFCSSRNELKITTGRDPVITEALLVSGDKVQRNSFNEISEVTGLQKNVNQCLAKLHGGLFTLLKFEGQLQLVGLMTFGPEKLYELEAQVGELTADFYLRADDFSLKRAVFRGYAAPGEKYEANYDFGPFADVQGFMMPTAWFSSRVGTRGNLIEPADFQFNAPLEKDFFTKLEVNVGTVEAGEGILKGNILDFNQMPQGLSISGNWRKKDIEKAGFKTGDRLIFAIEGYETELDFYGQASERPPMDVLQKGAQMLSPSPRDPEAYSIFFIATDVSQFVKTLKPLLPVQIKRK